MKITTDLPFWGPWTPLQVPVCVCTFVWDMCVVVFNCDMCVSVYLCMWCMWVCGDIKEVPYLPEKDSRTPPPRFPSQSRDAVIFPGADCHQSSTIPSWPMCVTIQGQTATSHQPFHPGLCVSLSRAHLSRLWFTKQSLKGVGHEGTPCLKGEQRHPPCPSKVPLS